MLKIIVKYKYKRQIYYYYYFSRSHGGIYEGVCKKSNYYIGVLIVLVICVLLNLRPVENFQQKYEGVDLSADVEGAVREGTYTKY